MEQKGMKALTNLLSKTAGLVFFSFLAISLGVVFGLLFEGWVKDQPGTPVGSENSTLETVDLPIETIDEVKPGNKVTKAPEVKDIKPVATVRFKVRVGPYVSRTEALKASQQLQSLGYPVYVGNAEPYAVQVGAFGARANADRLKKELTDIGYKVFVDKE